jgi:Histidine kinase-, DNA gyrase B-, and HSP90-like ATPase
MKELSLNILDIVQNSIRAKAGNISIEINEAVEQDQYMIVVSDNGSGIPGELAKNVTDPFVTTRTKRRMGLGLPLLKYHAELTGGGLTIRSQPGEGTHVEASFSLKHIDRQPLGDIVGVILLLLASNPGINFTYLHKTDLGEYRFSSEETKAYLEVDALTDKDLLGQIGFMISENLKEIGASGVEFKKGNEKFHEQSEIK